MTVRAHGSRPWIASKSGPARVVGLLLIPCPMVPSLDPDSSVLDVSVMTAIRSLGGPDEPDVYAEVARLFLIDVPIHLSALAAAIAATDSESVWQIAHRIRGSTLEMGAVRMAPLCGEIEQAARAGSLAHAAAQAERLDREFATARTAIHLAITSAIGG